MIRVRLVHGDIGSGKTRRAAAWCEAEALAGRSIAGVLALKSPTGRGFMDVTTRDEVALEHPSEGETALAVGRFRFRQTAFDWAVQRMEAAVATGVDAVIIDEVGPLEMRGAGFAPLLDRLGRDHPAIERVLLVRTSLVDDVVARFSHGASVVFDPPRSV